jgi:hypothetical protein
VKGSDKFGNVGIGERIILKLILGLKILCVVMWISLLSFF